jgi:oligoribonuclease
MTNSKKALFWVDLEMTGLDESVDTILEVAVVVTDYDFGKLQEYHSVVFQPPEVLEKMNDWCKRTHGESGLTAAVPHGKPLQQVEKELLEIINKFYAPQERVVLVGNSVGNDKRFIDKFMPEVAKRLHYRLIDVSSYKEIYQNKYGLKFEKKNSHRAVDDIYESIGELKYYLSFVQIPNREAQGAQAAQTPSSSTPPRSS